jgi:ubiquinol-cytochrome c reductase cytochrome b subunit
MKPIAGLLDWLDHRTGYRGFVHEALYERIPGGARWRYVWGSTLVFTFFVQVVTGLFLWMAYSPSAHTAWESVFHIQYQMQGGWLLRGLHHFTAQAMVVLLVLHLMQVVIDGAYRAPREVNFWLGLVLMMLVLGLSLTGYLLPWDQKGYWATRVATNLLGLVGQRVPELVVGGPDYGHETLTRFFAFHAGVLPLLLLFFLALHIALFRRHGISSKTPLRGADAPFWPDQAFKDAVACLAVLAVVLFLIVRPALFGGQGLLHTPSPELGAELGAPADPANPYSAARPEWYFLFLFQFLKLFEGHGATGEFFGAIIVPGLVMGFMFLMPFIGRWKLGHRLNIVYLLSLGLGIGWLTYSAYREDHRAQWIDWNTYGPEYAEVQNVLRACNGDREKIDRHFGDDAAKLADFNRKLAKYEQLKKSADYLDAVKLADEDARRAKELASRPERIPIAGASSLLNNDPRTLGRRLFERHCGSCHTHFDPDEPPSLGDNDRLALASAPNLFGFASRRWLTGLLDPTQIAGPNYFGNTSHKDGGMVDFVGGALQDNETWKKGELDSVVDALSARAKLPAQAAADKADQAKIKLGQSLIEDANRCAECHRLPGRKDALGTPPDLTGYGSRKWLTDFIGNPGHERFYGKDNDRMPPFAADSQHTEKNRLTADEIGYLVNWLRGDSAERTP